MAPEGTSTGHVFVCYAREDQDFVLKLAGNLKERGVPLWLDQWDIPVSADWEQAVIDALYDCTQFLVVLSPAAMASLEVRGELRTALEEEKPIVPVLYQKCRIPPRLRLIQHADFTTGDPDDQAGLAQVLQVLGAPESEAPLSEPTEPRSTGVTPTVEPAPPPPQAPERAAEPEVVSSPVMEPSQPFEPELILIPAGEFLMGSTQEQAEQVIAQGLTKGLAERELPQHPVYLPDYHIAKTPVTNAQYLAFVEAAGQEPPGHWKGGKLPGGKEEHPVVNVSWHDAMAYCRWLAKATGKAYRLPSEAEWEKAARGTDGRIWPWGNEWDPKRCNSREGGPGGTTPVGQYSPGGDSPYGCVDMAGNVWEWCATRWGKSYPYDVSEDEWSEEYLQGGAARVLRGGSWDSIQDLARCPFSFRYFPNDWYFNLGFRQVSPI